MSRLQATPRLKLNFPFQLTFEHPPLDVVGMFGLSRLLDFHETRYPPASLEKPSFDLVVDVLSVQETRTTIQVTPRDSMSYDEITREVAASLAMLEERLEGPVKVVELDWLIERKGVASDTREFQDRIM